jgi:steroid delta-isomerase-like uncharacterized protein
LNQKKMDVVDHIMAVDHVTYMAGLPGPLRGLQAWKDLAAAYYIAFPDLQVTVQDLIAEGDKVAARYTISGTQQGEFQGIPATGKHVTITETDIYRIVGGKIVEHWAEFDALGMLQQLGVVPAPGQSPS